MTTPKAIPQSTALTEANPNSLAELFSRDPEGYSSQDIDQVITEMRLMRAKWEATEGQVKPVKAKEPAKLQSQASAEDLGL